MLNYLFIGFLIGLGAFLGFGAGGAFNSFCKGFARGYKRSRDARK